MLTMTAETMVELAVRWQLVRVSALVYGLTAVVAAAALWKLHRWGYVALVAWVAAVILIGLSWPVVFPASTMPWWSALVWVAAVAAIMTPIARYVRRVLAAAA